MSDSSEMDFEEVQNSENLCSLDDLINACGNSGTSFALAGTSTLRYGSLIETDEQEMIDNPNYEYTADKVPEAVSALSLEEVCYLDESTGVLYCGPVIEENISNANENIGYTNDKPVLSVVRCSSFEQNESGSPTSADPPQQEHMSVSNEPEYVGDLNAGTKRRKGGNKINWKSAVNYQKRMQGVEYEAYKMQPSDVRKTIKVMRPAKSMNDACSSGECKSRKTRFCDKFSENDRAENFRHFWENLTDWGQRRAFVMSMVDTHPTKRKTVTTDSKRSETHHYFLKLSDSKRQVCRKMFINTLSIGKTQLHNWLKSKCRGRKQRRATVYKVQDKKLNAQDFVDNLQKLPSHYCRKDSKKLYLEPVFTTKRQLFRCYLDYCKTERIKGVSWFTFCRILEEKNIALYHPKKDKCDTCCSYEAGNLDKPIYEEHVEKYQMARSEKEQDKLAAIASKCHVLAMDVQAVNVSPVLTASALYYKTKLLVHNFTLYDLATRDVTCYLWDESEGDLSASVFATCVVSFLKKFEADTLPIIIWSDGCTAQNRNAMLSTALLAYSVQTNKIITQKFLEKGHTQMEVDSVHSAIERKQKGKFINVPQDYITICEGARNEPHPYIVKYMSHQDFMDYSNKINQRYTSIRPGTKAGDKCVTDIRQLRYDPNDFGKLQYKLNFVTPDWIDIPQTPRIASFNFPKLFKKRLTITARKYKDLMDLLHVIAEKYHTFYKELPVK